MRHDEALTVPPCSHLVSHNVLEDDPEAQQCYRSVLLRMLEYAVEKLDHKGACRPVLVVGMSPPGPDVPVPPAAVFSNVLSFSSRVFALVFFRIDGAGLTLLRALPPVKHQGLKRIMAEAGVEEKCVPPTSQLSSLDRSLTFLPHTLPLTLSSSPSPSLFLSQQPAARRRSRLPVAPVQPVPARLPGLCRAPRL